MMIMSETMDPAEVRERYAHLPYITPYESIFALLEEDGGLVELHEFHARGRCSGGSAWEVYHYARTSPLVLSARREGARNIFTCETGRTDLRLQPGVAGAGLEEVRVEGGEVRLTYAGLAGGGVAATLCRGMARGVKSVTVHRRGGGASLGRATLVVPALRKLTVGVDDTDDAERGATWSTVNELAFELEREGACAYLGHSIVQLFPENPYRTTNCCATAVVLACDAGEDAPLLDRFADKLLPGCYSGQCAVAATRKVRVEPGLRELFAEARSGMVTEERARRAAGGCGVEIREITGSRGLIGAVSALGGYDDPDLAVTLDGGSGR